MLPYNLVAAKGSESQNQVQQIGASNYANNASATNIYQGNGSAAAIMSSAGTMMTLAPDGSYISQSLANAHLSNSGTSSSSAAGPMQGSATATSTSTSATTGIPHTFVRYAPRGGRVHHHLPLNEAQVHAHQLGIAQQFATFALQSGTDLVSYQRHAAAMMGIDPARLNVIDPNRRLDGTEPALGLMLIKDDSVYTHIELLTKYPHLAPVNFTPVSLNPTRSSFLLVTCPERVVHASIKYASFVVEDPALFNRLFSESFGVGTFYLVFASADAGAFSGIAEVASPCVETPVVISNNGVATETVQQRARLKWVFVKNIPCFSASFVKVPRERLTNMATSNASVVSPLEHILGARMLHLFAEHIPAVSILMDFKYYDEAEAKGVLAESGHAQKKAALSQLQQRHGGMMMSSSSYRGGGAYFNNGGLASVGRGGFVPYANRPRFPQQQQQQGSHPAGFGGGYQQQQLQQQQRGGGFRGAGRGGGGRGSYAPPRGGGFVPTNTPGGTAPSSSRPSQQPSASQKSFAPSSVAAPPANRRIESSEGERVKLQTTFTFEPTRRKKQGEAKRALQQQQVKAEEDNNLGGEATNAGEPEEVQEQQQHQVPEDDAT